MNAARLGISIGLLGFVTLASGTAHAGELHLSKGFTPHPYTSELIERSVDHVYLGDLGYGKCGNSFTTQAPWFTFHLDEPLNDVNVVFQNPGGDNLTNAVLVFPNGGYVCAKRGNVYSAEWPKGEYKIWFFTSAQSVRATVRIEQPDRLKAAVESAFESAPVVRFTERPDSNPQFVEVTPGPGAHARVVETRCAKGTASVFPLARLDVERSGRFMIRGTVLRIESETACITDEATRQNNTLYDNEYVLKAGSYKVWGLGEPGPHPKPVVLQIDDLSQPLAFGEPVAKKELGTLVEPALLTAKTRTQEAWPARRNACNSARRASRAPDFYVHANEPLSRVRLSLYRNSADLTLRVYGPLEELKPYQSMVCDVEDMRFLTLEGTYAVWVSGEKGTPDGTEFHLLALREDVKVDPLKTLLDIPKELSMEERAIGNHYPFFRDMSPGYLFPRIPDRLFVYAVRDLKAGDDIVKAGEPLVVMGAGKGGFNLRRFDGTPLHAQRADLTETRPSKVVLPTRASFTAATTFDDAWRLVTPDDKARVDKINAVTDKYHGCVGGWMAKNDPTWGKSYDLVYVSGPRVGKTMSDIKFGEAAKACNEAGLIKAQEAFRQQMNAVAKQRVTSHLQAVRKRFGL